MQAQHRRHSIAFLTSIDPRDKRSLSGYDHYMAAALQRHCGDVTFLGPVPTAVATVGAYVNRLSWHLLGRYYDSGHSVLLARRYASLFRRKLRQRRFDVIVAPTAATELALLDTDIPIVYVSDATIPLLRNYYPFYSTIWDFSLREAGLVERWAMRKARLLVYPSAWAARSATVDYEIEESRVHVVPWGANLDRAPPPPCPESKKGPGPCRLLFLGVDWSRKGGDIAFETLIRLRELGLDAELTVCGCEPPHSARHERLTVIPFLDKNDPRQRERLDSLLSDAHFLLLPTRSECFGVVFCEASAFGVPSITADTGGVSGAVTQGVNGFMLPLEAGRDEYADLICRLYCDERAYADLVRSSRRAFEERLNWDAWAVSVGRLLDDI